MNTKRHPVRHELPDAAWLSRIDDGELCSYELHDGELVERVVRPARAHAWRNAGRVYAVTGRR